MAEIKQIPVFITFRLPIVIKKSGKWYVSSCNILDVHSQGETRKKAQDNLIEAISLFLETCIEEGTFDEVIKDCGLNTVKDEKIVVPAKNYINVPVNLLAKDTKEKHCHA